jgi:hypothetical protein
MLTAIQFDNELSARRTEIGDVIAYGMLWAEVNIARAVGTQMRMEFAFMWRHISAQFFSTLEDFGRGAFMHLDPHPALPHFNERKWGRRQHGLEGSYGFHK